VKPYKTHKVQQMGGAPGTGAHHDLIAEEPLAIRIQGQPYAVIMRTPGDEIAHAAGFCLAEGIVDEPDDIKTLGLCDEGETNVVTVTLSSARSRQIPELLQRRSYISQTSCGLCGKQVIRDLQQAIAPLENRSVLDLAGALDCLTRLSARQPVRQRTRAAHAAAVYDGEFRLLSAAEDVGRHNALDKAVGRLFLDRRLAQAVLLILSSRISYELVQKSARARLPVVMAKSRPTALAVELASALNMTLACKGRTGGAYVYSAPQRLK